MDHETQFNIPVCQMIAAVLDNGIRRGLGTPFVMLKSGKEVGPIKGADAINDGNLNAINAFDASTIGDGTSYDFIIFADSIEAIEWR